MAPTSKKGALPAARAVPVSETSLSVKHLHLVLLGKEGLHGLLSLRFHLLFLLAQSAYTKFISLDPLLKSHLCRRELCQAGLACGLSQQARPSSVTHSPSSAVHKGACKDGHTCCLFRAELITRTNKIGNWLLQEAGGSNLLLQSTQQPVVLLAARGVPDGCTTWLRGFSIACPPGQRPSFPPACQVLPSRRSCSCRGDCPSASHPEVTALALLLQLYPIV